MSHKLKLKWFLNVLINQSNYNSKVNTFSLIFLIEEIFKGQEKYRKKN